jgi:hypothetical protein
MGKVNFNSIKSLNRVGNLVEAADQALKDKTIVSSSTVSGLLNAFTFGSLATVAATFATTVAAPVAVPVIVLDGLIVATTATKRASKLREEKERLYNLAIQKHQAIINELSKEVAYSKERIQYLESINILLQKAVIKLQEDLGE